MILSALLTVVIVTGVFSILIIVHECGHFFAARKIGVRVERFAIGFGKKLIGIKRGDTEYAINLIPLGGFVKLAGEDPYDRKGEKDEFYSKPVGLRFWVIVAGSLCNYVFGYLFSSCFFRSACT